MNHGLYIFDSFKEFDGRRYVALNNFPGKQNALAVLHDDFTTFEVIGHYNEPQSQQLSESAVNRLPDGTWMAICRNDGGNYHFTTSQDGKTWTIGEPKPYVPNGLNSKPTFDKFDGVYYLGWQENTRFRNCDRSVFNVDISRDGKTWERKYRFESPNSFQYPTFHEHEGTIWLTVTQSDHLGSTDRIMFGKLETVGEFETQQDQKRIEWPAQLAVLHAADAPPSPVKTGVILVNHVGFPPNAPKHCVIPSPPQKEFTIHRLKDTAWTQVFAGVLAEGGNQLEPGWVGDFSAVKDDSIYQVHCGSLRSRAFTVYAGVYDVPMRVVFNYFSLMGLVKYGGLQKPYWDQGSIAEPVPRSLHGIFFEEGNHAGDLVVCRSYPKPLVRRDLAGGGLHAPRRYVQDRTRTLLRPRQD